MEGGPTQWTTQDEQKTPFYIFLEWEHAITIYKEHPFLALNKQSQTQQEFDCKRTMITKVGALKLRRSPGTSAQLSSASPKD